MKALITAAVAGLAVAAPAVSAEDDAHASRVMWSAFVCSEFAAIMGDSAEAERLFLVGYQAGQKFMAAVQAGTITEEEARTILPLAVALLMEGPNTEFVLGRIYHSASGAGFDQVVTRDASGMPLAPRDYHHDPKLRESIAWNKYHQGNCKLL